VQLQLLQLGFRSLVMVWTFCLGYGLDSLLGALALEIHMLLWLAIGSKGFASGIILSVKVKVLGVASAYGRVIILLYCLWKNEHIS
jgi:hypothetical protein